MSEIKWIKITTDMFDNRKIKAIRKLPEGNNIILIWVMLLSLAGRCNASGMIFLTENIPYTNKMLSDELGFDESVICIALNTLEKFGMISRDEKMLISVNNWCEYQNVDAMEEIREYERIRKAKQRSRKKEISIKHSSECIEECSFMSSKSNTENLKCLLFDYDNSDFFNSHQKLLKCVEGWMEYKDQKKPRSSNHYDSKRGMKAFLDKVVSQSKSYGEECVIDVINDSIANNYQGVVWDKIQGPSKKKKDVFDEWRNA